MFTGAGWPMWQVWGLYLLTGVVALGLIFYPIRHWSRWLLLFLFATIAAIMFAPLPISEGSDFWAPAALIFIVDLKNQLKIGFWHALLPIISLWIAFMALGTTWILKKKPQQMQQDGQDD